MREGKKNTSKIMLRERGLQIGQNFRGCPILWQKKKLYNMVILVKENITNQ